MVPQIQPHVPSTATIPLWTLLLPRAFSVAFPLVFLPPRSPSPQVCSHQERICPDPSQVDTTPPFHILPWLLPTWLRGPPNLPYPFWPP